jgi:hypothetical protein
MGGLISGLYGLFSGNPAQQEENALGSLAGYEGNTGEGAVNAGLGFYNSILSGNPEEIAQALAPEISAGQGQIQQQAEQNAFFGNRGGGTNASTQAAQAQQRGNLINLIGGLQQGAAGAELGAGMGLLGQSGTNYMNEAELANQWRQQQLSDIGDITQGVGQIFSGLTGGGGGGMFDPYQALYNAQHADMSSLSTESPEVSSGLSSFSNNSAF